MASGPGQPGQAPGRLAGSLARHRWVTAAGMTATIAAVAGGGLALAVHNSSPGAPEDCGLVPCAAALPASVQSGGAASAGAAATASPTAIHRASRPSASAPAASATAPEAAPPPAQPASPEPVSVSEPLASSAPAASSAGRAVSADRAIGVGYAITGDSHHGIHGEFVIVNNSSAPVSRWRVTVVLPGDAGYRVQDAGNLSAGDALVMTAPRDGQALAGRGTELIAFTARGTTSTPARCTFTESARPQATRDGSGGRGSAAAGNNRAAGDQPGAARDGHHGWLAHWLAGSPPGSGWGAHGREGGRAGTHHGWPGGR